jgi:hypothetical protein
MEELENRRAVELVKKLHIADGVAACSAEELVVVSYPKEEVGPLFGFSKKDLEAAIELKLLAKARTKAIDGKEFQVYMKTANVPTEA